MLEADCPTLLPVAPVPLLHFLAHTLVYFVTVDDYHPDWVVAGLNLPPSDGTHRQLRREHFPPAL
jgi:hypothetical protein